MHPAGLEESVCCIGAPGEDGKTVDSVQLSPDPARPDIIDKHVVVADQGVDEKAAGAGHCRQHGVVYRHGQLLRTTLPCYKVMCSGGELSWVPARACCPSDGGLQPEQTRQPTEDVCLLRECTGGRWKLRPDYDLCCKHEHAWYPVGSTRPMQGGPCTYHLCHAGRWEPHYNTTCCFDEVGWHTPGTVLFTADPCRSKTCRAAHWTERDTCCREPITGRRVAAGDIRRVDACTYQLCHENTWHRRTAFSCCERKGHQYEHGAVANLGSTCRRDRCVDGSWHVVRRERLGRGPCRSGWRRLGHRCVARLRAAKWHDGRKRCRTVGGYLLTVTTKEGWRNLAKSGGNVTIWLGLRGHELVEGVTEWRWMDGTPRSVPIMWAAREPRILPGRVCAYVVAGRVHSASCDEKHEIICESTRCEH
ncbi:uncharacterized protein LOC119095606 isoform X2 [Pollicipes pollicipes]|uniref:uncharacterized protein LOC119095606 isoform X2 n=1 Tax=Pollicipes pollicipes TaxID=41117 RepID=UPI00188533B5|nr:uncharacterized protein LOC119095606 isoform X2 [Pollicipes pollicipes]